MSQVGSVALKIVASSLTAAARSPVEMLPSNGTASNTLKSIIILKAGRIRNFPASERSLFG